MKRMVLVMASVALVAAGCSSDGGDDTTPNSDATPTTGAAAPRRGCDADAFAKAQKPVKVVYWHSQTQANLAALESLTKQFNESQSDVEVTLQNQGGTDETLTKYRNVAGTADAPDLLQLGETSLKTMIDSNAVVAAQACLDATKSNVDDLLPRVRSYYTVSDAMWAMPFNVSQPVLLYNKNAFRNAGLDPEAPPTNFEELQVTARSLKERGGFTYGFQYKRDTWVLEHFLALAGEPYVDRENGRAGRATKAVFDTDTATTVLSTLQQMVDDGVATTNPTDGPEQFSNLLGICNGTNAMTFDSSAVLGTAYENLAKGECKVQVDVGVAPLPLPAGPGKGGTLVGGAANFIARPRDEHSAKTVAAFVFAQYLTRPDVQATWAAKTGYIPISRGAATETAIVDVWNTKPGYKVAYDQLANGAQNVATAGPLIGAYKDVRTAMKTALEALFLDGAKPADVIATALQQANAAIAAYNANNE